MTPDALDRIYREHGHAVLRRARRLLRNEDDALDVMRDVFLDIFRNPGAFEARSSIATYLYAATTHACLNRIRDGKNRTQLVAIESAGRSALAPAHGETRALACEILAELAEYTWDNLDHMVQLVQTRSFDDARAEIVAHYNTLGDLVEYTWAMSTESVERYAYADFNEAGLPTRQVVSQNGVESHLQLQYDARGRVVLAIPDEGAPTIYSYDDDARTTTVDTANGASHGVFVYDERNHMISETWDGTHSSVVATQELYEWDGDRLLAVTHRSATPEAPHELRTTSVDTYRYDCTSR